LALWFYLEYPLINRAQQWLIKHKGDSAFCRAVAESNPAKSLIWFKNENLKQNNRFGYSVFAGMSGIISLTLHSRAVRRKFGKSTIHSYIAS
jgi:hypothetical protein